MRTVRAGLSLAAAALAFAPAATGAAPAPEPRVSATPDPVRFGQTLTVRGRDWPVIEFCSRRVRLSLRSDQNALRLGTARVRDGGRFTFRWKPRRSEVGAGRWRVVARLRCESGKDGSPVVVRRSDRVRIRR